MMGALKTKMEEQLELSEDGRLQKESTNKVRGIMEENKITERQDNCYYLYSGCLGWSNANLCNDIVEKQIEEYKKKKRQRVDWVFSCWSNANLCNDIVGKQIEEYKKKKRQRRVIQGLAFSRSNANLCDDIVEEQIEEYTKKERQREGWAFSRSNANLCNDIEEGQMEEYKKKERQRERDFHVMYMRHRHFFLERTIKTTLIEMMGKWKQREGNAVVEDDAIMEREKQTDVTEKLSGEFDDEEKEKRELEQLLRCKVCLDSDACVVLFPCRHMATCEYCEGFLQCCPVCRSFIDEAVKVNEEN